MEIVDYWISLFLGLKHVGPKDQRKVSKGYDGSLGETAVLGP